MADIPRILTPQRLPEVDLPRTSGREFGAQVFGELAHGMAHLSHAMREKQKPIDAARLSSEYDIAVDDLKNEVQSDPEPNNWRDTFMTKEPQIRQKMLEGVTDPEVKRALGIHIERNLGRHVIDLSSKGVAASHVKQLSDIETVGNTLARQAAEATDKGIRDSAVGAYSAMITAASQPTMIGGRAVPGALNAKQAEEKRAKFQVDVLKNRMEMLALSQSPEDWSRLTKEHNEGNFALVPPDDRARILERGRTHKESIISNLEKQKNEMKRLVDDEWSGMANFGQLTDDRINRALRNEDPFISPDRARTLKSINDNPPTGEGGDSVRAIMSEYYSGPRSISRIDKTRRELNRLQSQMGRPNPLISKANNELQSDQTAVESIDVQRTNQRARDAVTAYDAEKPVLPFNMPFLQNMDRRNKALIEDAVRKGRDPKEAVKQKTLEQKNRIDAIPQRNKKVLELK